MPVMNLKKMFCGYLVAVWVIVEWGNGFALFYLITAM
jgi:hypothetical protein